MPDPIESAVQNTPDKDVTEQFIVDLTDAQSGTIGTYVKARFTDSRQARSQLELNWLEAEQNLRRVYPVIELKDLETRQKSSLFSGLTKRKVTTFEARMIELLFPRNDRNWGLEAKKHPLLGDNDLNIVLQELINEQSQMIQQQAAAQAQQTGTQPQPIDPNLLVQLATNTITSDMVEARIAQKSDESTKRMQDKINDYLSTIGGSSVESYEFCAGTVFRHATRYRVGILKGPTTDVVVQPRYAISNGALQVTEAVAYRPHAEVVIPFDWYPDFGARRWEDCEYHIQRHMLSRTNYYDFTQKPGWRQDRGVEWLNAFGPNMGDRTEVDFDYKLRNLDISDGGKSIKDRDRFEVFEFWGNISKKTLKEWEITPPSILEDSEHYLMGLWVVHGQCARAVFHPINPFRMFHCFVYDTNSSSMLGDSFVTLLQTAQKGMNASIRALSDNAAHTAGPMAEVDTDIAQNGASIRIVPFGVVYKDGAKTLNTNARAVNIIDIPDKTAQLAEVSRYFEEMADKDTFINTQNGGDMTPGTSEAMRTRMGVTALMGNTALPFRDAVTNFDRFVCSFIDALTKWESTFGGVDYFGDVVPVARGSRNLLGREVANAELTSWANNMPQWMLSAIKVPDVTRAVAEAQNFDAQQYVKTDDEYQQDQAAAQQQQQALQQAQLANMAAEEARTKADAFKSYTQGIKNTANANSVAIQAVIKLLGEGMDDSELANTIAAAGAALGGPSAAAPQQRGPTAPPPAVGQPAQ